MVEIKTVSQGQQNKQANKRGQKVQKPAQAW